MKNPRFPTHPEASARGGFVQSQTEHVCPRCGKTGAGNNFLGGHIDKHKNCPGYVVFDTSRMEERFEEIRMLVNQLVKSNN